MAKSYFEMKKQKITTAIINGRLTEKSINKWIKVPKFAQQVFSNFKLCLASSQKSKKFFEFLNIKDVKYLGNIKFTKNINIDFDKIANKSFLKDRIVWSAVSTHDGEELFCLKAHLKLKKNIQKLITFIIPRHINRCNKIKKMCDELKLNSQILNENELISRDKEIIIINSFGSLSNYLYFSKCVFIGKSIPKKFKFNKDKVQLRQLNLIVKYITDHI